MFRAPTPVLFLLPGLAAQATEAAPAIDWQTDFTAARESARESHRPLLVVFRCER